MRTVEKRTAVSRRTTALVYLSSLHPRRKEAAARGGPSGEMLMSDSLMAGLENLGVRTKRTGILRSFLILRTWQIMFSRNPGALFLDPWSLALARRYHALSPRLASRTFVLEWFGTTRAAIPTGAELGSSSYLFPYPSPMVGNRFLGFVLRSPAGSFLTNEAELRICIEEASLSRRAFGVVWGKEPRYFGATERALIRRLALVLPMHLTVNWGSAEPLSGPGILNHGHLDPQEWRNRLGNARFVLGLGDPILGPTALEALLAGSVLLNPRFAPARSVDGNPGVLFDSQHPFAASIGSPHVLSIDPAQAEQTARTVQELMNSAPEPARESLLRGLSDFTLDRYVSRLADIVWGRITAES